MTGPRACARRLCATVLAGHLIVLAPWAGALADEPRPRFTAWQEIVLLTVAKVRHAAAGCGFRVDAGQVDALLASAALGGAAVDPRDFSPSLARQVNADADLYLGPKDDACAQAWDRYGPDGVPGLRNTLGR